MSDFGWIVTRIRPRKCGHGKCGESTRVAMYVPCADITADNSPGVALIPLCGDHIVESVLAFTATVNRKNPRRKAVA